MERQSYSSSIIKRVKLSQSKSMKLLILLFLVPFAFAGHSDEEEWTGQVTLTDGSGEELSFDNNWNRSRTRRRHLHLSSTDSAGDDWEFNRNSHEDWEFNDLIFDADESCVKCPGIVHPCRCPTWERCRFVRRTCRQCPHYTCEK